MSGLVAAFALLLGVALAYAFRRWIKPDAGDPLIGLVLFAPALVYGASALPVRELSGFGFSAKFDAATRQTLARLDLGVAGIAFRSLSDPDLAADAAQAAFFELCLDYVVVTAGSVPEADEGAAFDNYIVNSTHMIRSSLACGRFIGLIVLDERRRYLGSYDAGFFAESLATWAVAGPSGSIDTETLSKRIQTRTTFGAALRFPVERIVPGEGFTAAINESQTLRDAAEKLASGAAPFLVVTDALGTFVGLLTREMLHDRLFGLLLAAEEGTPPWGRADAAVKARPAKQAAGALPAALRSQ